MKITKYKNGEIGLRVSPEEFAEIQKSVSYLQFTVSQFYLSLPYWDQESEHVKSQIREAYERDYKRDGRLSDLKETFYWFEWAESHPSKPLPSTAPAPRDPAPLASGDDPEPSGGEFDGEHCPVCGSDMITLIGNTHGVHRPRCWPPAPPCCETTRTEGWTCQSTRGDTERTF